VLRSQLRTLEEALNSIVEAIGDGRVESLARLDSVDLSLGTVDARLDSVDLSLGTVDARLNDITEIQASVQTELVGVRQYTDHWLSFSYPKDVEGISAGLAEALNFSSGHRGYASQSNLWFNPALSLRYSESSVQLQDVNERIVEATFVLAQAVALTPQGGKILDLGCDESLIAYELASYGFEVVGVDLNDYPLSHPNLRTLASPAEAIDDDDLRGFDTIVCLSAIEHFGLGAYGEEPTDSRADIEALQRLAALSHPETSLILTTPFGEASVTKQQRVYDSDGLGELLDAWNVTDQRFAHRTNGHWIVEPDPRDKSDGHSVALVIATPKK